MDKTKFFTPTKIKNFLSCKYIVYNEFYKKDLGISKKQKTKNDELRLKKGNEHEDNYFLQLKKKYKKTIDLKKNNLDYSKRFKETLMAMQDGYEVIRGGVLIQEDWVGETDFLIKTTDLKSKFGNFSYVVHETKNTKKTKVDHIIQAGIYTLMLESAQEIQPASFSIVLKEYIIDEIQFDKISNYIKSNKEKYEHFISNDLEKAKPEKCSFCNICDWIEVCEKQWIESDNLNQIGNTNKSQRKKLIDSGIKTITQLAEKDENFKVKNLNPDIFRRINISAKLRKKYEKTQEPCIHVIEENLKIEKGFNSLPEEKEGDLFFDIESVQDHVVSEGLEYLFGIYYIENKKEKFKTFWAHSKEEEKNTLIQFFDFTEKHFKKYPDAKIYHYASYEITALRKLVAEHSTHGSIYDRYLRLFRFVDLFAIVKNAILTSENSYSLKNLEKFYNFKRLGDLQKGDASQDFYVNWLETKDQSLLDEIEFYNRQDCHSTYELRKWLNKIRPEECTWYLPPINDSDKVEKPFEIKLGEYLNYLETKKLKNPAIKTIASHILEFFRRDNRPDYRSYFVRKNMSHEELIEDTECIGYMTQVGEPYREKLSNVYTFSFPDQEYKIKKGDVPVNANNILVGESKNVGVGSVIELDPKKREIKLKKGIKGSALGKILSIGKKSPPNINNLEDAIYRYIDTLFSGNKKDYDAINDILAKNVPRIKEIKEGSSIIDSNNFIEEIPKVILNLNNSYLFIQGPPGTGKTTQASNVIAELISKGKKIGVVANSHRVVHNLISKVEKVCENKKINFSGFKKGTANNEESIYEGNFITTCFKDDNYPSLLSEKHQLYAGTKYHFAKEYYDQKLDYMFVDEAGQLTTADIVAVGTAAKNIVLIGDQMQLPQPSNADHPGESGKSILEYLLEGSDTVPNEKGIFLSKTFRMNPKINKFISENFYENRLLCDEITSKRKIIFQKSTQIQSDGIHFISADHTDCSQKNEIEGKIIKDLYNQLSEHKIEDEFGKIKKLTNEDILTISPYNIQVNYLKSILPKDSRVGTIDKFQGQEAPITIISMTSSDSDNLPRAKNFFFNRNRLNVAISRAQLMSIIIFNPLLLQTSAHTLEEIYLIENFFKLMKYKVN